MVGEIVPDRLGNADIEAHEKKRRALERRSLLGSAVAHTGLALLLLLWRPGAPDVGQPIAVGIVELSDQTTSPLVPNRSVTPQQKAGSPPLPAPNTSAPTPGPTDELEAKLRALARLRAPSADTRLTESGTGVSEADARSDGALGSHATYAIKDYIRAQVERRWNLNLALLGNRNFSVLIRVEITSNGVVKMAEIVDQARFVTDKAFREIALSARNAILLSSPIALPVGRYDALMSMTLSLNPRDVLR